MPYQSFEDRPGLSDSAAKLAALRLPDLAGKSVLDLGCAEGFFCRAALQGGARRVLGLDLDAEALEEARRRAPGAELRHASWWDLPDERFDVILFLAGLEHEPEPARLMEHLARHLAPGGLLVVEARFALHHAGRGLRAVRQDGRTVNLPTEPLLREEVLAPFVSRSRGRSPGLPLRPPYHLFHCRARQPMLLLIGGRSGYGKSTLARSLGRLGAPVHHLDTFIGQVQRGHLGEGSFVGDVLRRLDAKANVLRAVNRLGRREMEELARLLVAALSRDTDLQVVEGYPLSKWAFARAVRRLAEQEGFRVHATAEVGREPLVPWPLRWLVGLRLRRRSG